MGAHQQRRLLWIVDDSHLDAERARAALSDDFDIEVFHDGAEVIEHLADSPSPDVLVLDWLMPTVSGLDVLRYVRSAPRLERLSVLVLTALDNSSNVVTALQAGANDFVSKPYSGAELRARVEALMRTRDLIDRAELTERAVRYLLDTSDEAVFTLDDAGAVYLANEPAATVLQRTCAEVTGRTFEELLGKDAAKELSRMEPGGPPLDLHVRDRVLEARLRRLVDVGLGTSVLTLRDVTEQRRADEERRDFYAIVAHDMRSPLFSMLLRIELLMDGAKGPLPATATQELMRMKEQIGRMSQLLNDFLDLGKMSEASFRLNAAPTNVDALVRDVASEFQPLLASRELVWRHETCRHACAARVDGARIRQAVMNLFVNAANYTPAGGVITTSTQHYEDAIEFAIEDTGPGIDASELQYVFDRYRRAHSAGGTSGTGLGLMIVRRVIEAHGGEIGVDSRPGLGSRFWFRVPVDIAHPLDEASRAHEPDGAATRAHDEDGEAHHPRGDGAAAP